MVTLLGALIVVPRRRRWGHASCVTRGASTRKGPGTVTRILVVDDTPALRMLLVDALADAGFEARGAEHGRAALAIAESWPPDAIILDIVMPVMDGPGFLRARRERPALATVPVLVLTAQPAHDRQLQGLDATAILRKPYDLDELLDAVGSLVARETGREEVG